MLKKEPDQIINNLSDTCSRGSQVFAVHETPDTGKCQKDGQFQVNYAMHNSSQLEISVQDSK